MKNITCILLFILFLDVSSALGQTKRSDYDWLPDWFMEEFENSTVSEEFVIMARLSPLYLSEDFDGGGEEDLAVCVMDVKFKKYGLLLLLKESMEFVTIAAGEKFESIGDDLTWIDEWGVESPGKSYTTLLNLDGDITGVEDIQLFHPSISLRETEGSGGLVYFDGEKFIWIHQGD